MLQSSKPDRSIRATSSLRGSWQGKDHGVKEQPCFSEKVLADLESARKTAEQQYNGLIINYTYHPFKSPRATEFASHAFARRLRILRRCLDNVFKLVPPNCAKPSQDDLQDATISLHAFYANLFGAFDNLAWVWVLERDVKAEDGKELSRKAVGIGPNSRQVRGDFPATFDEFFDRFDQWQAEMVGWRDALVHRVPIYIPPSVLNMDDAAKAQQLNAEQTEALKRFDFEKYDKLFEEQMQLGQFVPWMQHSFGENAKPIWFHGQMLNDFQLLAQLAEKLIEELRA